MKTRLIIAATAIVSLSAPGWAQGAGGQQKTQEGAQQSAQQPGAQQFSQGDHQKLMKLEQDRQNAVKRQDANALSKVYSKNATAENADGDRASGHKEISSQAQKDAKKAIPVMETSVVTIEQIDKDTALIDAKRQVAPATAPELAATLRTVSIAKREGKDWKLVASREFASVPVALIQAREQERGTGGAGQQPQDQQPQDQQQREDQGTGGSEQGSQEEQMNQPQQ